VGNEADGLWPRCQIRPYGDTISARDNTQLNVIRLDPNTGTTTIEAVLPPLPQLAAETGMRPDTTALFNDAFEAHRRVEEWSSRATRQQRRRQPGSR
jgi:hypothetical protein